MVRGIIMERWQLKQRQSLPLEAKVELSKFKIRKWWEHWQGQVYVSFSGGKDSTVLLDLVRSEYPDIPAVFVDTGLEYPEIRDFVKTIDNVTWLKPKMGFKQVLRDFGYPVVSKLQARYVRDVQNATDKNKATVKLRLTGLNRKGIMCPSMKLSKKWLPLTKAPFKVSEKCCDVIKKEPFHRYTRESNRKPFTGTMAGESTMRAKVYLRSGCNAFDGNDPKSNPIAFWTEDDIWGYIKLKNLPYSKIYDMGEKRTGCMFCMFGVHLEKGENRFQRMQRSHPKQWNYCINKLGLGEVLDFIGVKYESEQELFND